MSASDGSTFARPPVRSIGRWQLGHHIGAGGLADVWSAVRDDGARAAIKVMRDPAAGPREVRRFLREGRYLSGAGVPGLPRCMGFGEEPVPHVILEALDGCTVAEWLDRHGAFSVERVLSLAERLLEVVSHLHRQGIIHRDIKPGNLFLTRSGGLKVMDLGLARDAASTGTTTLGDVLGTWAYMAPEQLVGAEVDHRCDLFSVGVTLYEMLTGHLPLSSRTPLGQLEALRDGKRIPVLVRVPEVPDGLARAIEQLMAWDPDGRPPTAAIALAVLVGASHTSGASRVPIIGRAAALGALEAALDARMTVIVLGGTGSGLQRMRGRAIERATIRGFDVIGVRAGETAHGLRLLDSLALQLARFVDTVPETVPGLAANLSALSAESPLLLVVEQVDRASAGVRRDLARLLEAVPDLAVIMTAERDPVGLHGHRVELRPLSALETERLVAAILGASGCPAGLGPILHRATRGLPGLIALAIRELVERGSLWAEGVDELGRPRWHLDRRTPVDPTVGLARLYGRSIARLPPAARRLLEVLAVAGQYTGLEAILEVAEVSRAEAVPPVVDGGLVHIEAHPDGERAALAQPGTGTLLARQLSPLRTAEIHAGLASALARAPDAVWLEPRIRWHRAHGLGGARAADELLELGEDLRLRGQLGAAGDVLDVALQARPTAALSAAVHLARGKAFAAMSRWAEAGEALELARGRALKAGVVDIDADAGVWLAEVQTARGDSVLATSTIERVLQMLEAVHSPDIEVRALVTAAELHRRAAFPEAALRLVRRAVAVARAESDESLELQARAAEANLLLERGRIAEGRKHLVAFADHLRFTGRTHLLVPVLYRLGVAWRRSGRIDRALEALDEAADVCRYAQRPHDRALERVGRAGVLLAVGDLDQATRVLGQARVEADQDCPSSLRLAYRDVQLSIRLARDDAAAALAVAQVAEAEAARAGQASNAAFHLGMVGVLTANGEAIDEALDQLATAGDRRLAACLLLAGAALGRDREVFAAAEHEARTSGDRFLMLELLYIGGSSAHRVEAKALCEHVLPHIPSALAPAFRARTVVRWAQPSSVRSAGSAPGKARG